MDTMWRMMNVRNVFLKHEIEGMFNTEYYLMEENFYFPLRPNTILLFCLHEWLLQAHLP